ncbi:MAG: hypothetical protein H0T89_02790 [Deltaproteobacteria bacterium]|nr:hypothetical protein [Deltaproteobacteria bacterium]
MGSSSEDTHDPRAPEEDKGANGTSAEPSLDEASGGAPGADATPGTITPEPSVRARSLADRVDSMLTDDDPELEADPAASTRADLRADDIAGATDELSLDDGIVAARDAGETMLDSSAIELSDLSDIEEVADATELPAMPIPPPPRMPPLHRSSGSSASPPPRPVVVVPPRTPPMSMKVPPVVPRGPGSTRSVPISVPAVSPLISPLGGMPSSPTISVPPKADDSGSHPVASSSPSIAIPRTRTKPPSTPPLRVQSSPSINTTGLTDDSIAPRGRADLSEGGIDAGTETATPNLTEGQPLEAQLESPTVVDRAIAELGDTGGEKRAEEMERELETTSDPLLAAMLAYELGELYERRLADEARAVKAYGRALALDPSLRPNLWAIRRVFYRRGLWPNLVKLIAAEVSYARDDVERADLFLEKARVAARMDDLAEARSSLDEAATIAPQHQGALLELERIVARAGDVPALLDIWERLADAVEQPARKISYLIDIGRTAAASDYERARSAFERSATLATEHVTAERVGRERLRIAEEHGTPEDVLVALDALATLLLQSFGPAGPSDVVAGEAPDRATYIRREIVALRRRQAQLSRTDAPERAWDVLQQALAMAPGDPVVLNDLTELAEELGRYAELAELVQSWQAVEGDEGRAMVLSIRRADALLRGGQRDQARALLASLEASAPGFIVLTSAAERDALGRGDPEALAGTYLGAAHAAVLGSWLGPGQPPAPDPGAAAALYVQAAELLAYNVAAPNAEQGGGATALDEARSALGNALEAVPGYAPAHEALTELDDATGNVAGGLARLRAAAAATRGEAARPIYDRAIRLARAHGDLESVLELESAVAELAPDELALRWRLECTLAQLGRDDERAQLLTEIASMEGDATRRGTALFAAARLRERGGAVESATELYRQVLTVWPEDTFSRESLVDLLRAQERWPELVAERRAEAAALSDTGGGEAARRALREAAWVLEVRLAEPAAAAQVHQDWLARFPEDRGALEGLARCAAHSASSESTGNAGHGEVIARRRIADLEPSPETAWLYGRALERAGQFDEAADAFRALAADKTSVGVAATTAALALADLAAARGDTVMRVEATAALASRTTDPRLGAALAEDSGWMYALVLEDFDRAAQAFAAAITLDPTRRGALLGAALVAARRGDPTALSAAYDGLAAAVDMPSAAAALHLRAAAMAAASGDLELANQRVAAARAHAPDDLSALLVVAETGTLPIVEEGAGDVAIDPLLARAEVLELRGALADDPVARASWELDRAEALELAGRLREASAVAVAVLTAHPADVRALEAMRRMAKRAGDDVTWAQASYELARVIGDPAAKLALLRDAASVLDSEGSPATSDQAVALYQRILQVDAGAPELERMLELMRQRADVRGLIAALTDRLTWLESENQDVERDQQMVPLLLERATVVHGLGDQAAAMIDLDALLDRAKSHAEALRFRADLAFHAGEVEQAVTLWRRCIAAETRPHRRQEIELQLAQVLAENINDIGGAIENMERVVEGAAGSGDEVQLRERLFALCLRANDWERATRELRSLARLRPSPQEKAREELRLGLMLRDKLNDRTGARLALDRARSFDPLNLDVVRELSEIADPNTRTTLLASTAKSFRSSIAQNPKAAVLYDRLAQVTGWQSDVDARWLALVGLEALGTPSVDQKQVLEQGRATVHTVGANPEKHRLDEAARQILRGGAVGALADLWRAIAPAVQVATGVDPGKLGFARGDRIALKKLGERYDALANALASFAIDDVEVYVSAARGGIARALAAETPILVVGADVAAAKTPQQRWQLGRAVATLAEGFSTLPDLREVELGWTFAAALRAVDLPIPPGIAEEITGEDTSIAERAKILKKELGRKARALVQQIGQRTTELVDVAGFRRNAIAVGNRAGLLWAGDLAVALAQLDVGKGGKALADNPAALELAAWSVSEEHGWLRERLGVALKGAR